MTVFGSELLRKRWPAERLLEVINYPNAVVPHCLALTDILGISYVSTLEYFGDSATKAGLNDELAEQLAMRVGYMPHEIWPDWFDVVLENDADREASDRLPNGRWRLEPVYEAADMAVPAELAAATGLLVSGIRRMANEGLGDRSARQMAGRLNLHPASIWKTWTDVRNIGAAA